jgi:hypothetical protein
MLLYAQGAPRSPASGLGGCSSVCWGGWRVLLREIVGGIVVLGVMPPATGHPPRSACGSLEDARLGPGR